MSTVASKNVSFNAGTNVSSAILSSRRHGSVFEIVTQKLPHRLYLHVHIPLTHFFTHTHTCMEAPEFLKYCGSIPGVIPWYFKSAGVDIQAPIFGENIADCTCFRTLNSVPWRKGKGSFSCSQFCSSRQAAVLTAIITYSFSCCAKSAETSVEKSVCNSCAV